MVRKASLNFATSFDVRDGRWIDLDVQRQVGLPGEPAEIRQLLPEDLRGDARITTSGSSSYQDLGAFGGMRLRDDGTAECTSGWAVRNRTTLITGITGAGHCNGINAVMHPGDGEHSVNYTAEHRGDYGDVEWYTSGVNEPDNFYADSSDVRDVAGTEARSAISIGEPVCIYGRSSNNRDCSLQVEDVSQACTVNGVFNDRLVGLDGTGVATGGDSGGGVSYGSTAIGSIKGFCSSNGWLHLSVADLYDEALIVVVRQ